MGESGARYAVRCLRTAVHSAPAPVFLYMEGFGETIDVNCYFWLIQGGGLNVLVDTGMGGDYPGQLKHLAERAAAGFPVPEGEDTLSRLAQHGLTPDDIDIVILSHLHYDHIANVLLFRKARVVVNRRGWEAAKVPPHPVFDVFPNELLARMDAELGDRLELTDDEQEIVPGISVLWTGGHTACSQAVAIATKRGEVVLTGDVAYLYDNLERQHPIGLGVNLYESAAALAMLKARGATLLPGHDARILERYPSGVIVD